MCFFFALSAIFLDTQFSDEKQSYKFIFLAEFFELFILPERLLLQSFQDYTQNS